MPPSALSPALAQRFPLFADFTAVEMDAVTALLEPVVLRPGVALFRQGDPSDSLFLLLEGDVEITLHIPGHEDHRLVTLGAGTIIGEMGPLIDEPRAASAIAVGDARLARLSGLMLEAALERGERWAGKFLFATAKVLARRLSLLNSELVINLAQVEDARSHAGKKVEAELSTLRQRLLKDWTF